jgi:hypothetical protein
MWVGALVSSVGNILPGAGRLYKSQAFDASRWLSLISPKRG